MAMAEIDRGYRSELRYGGGDHNLQIVTAKADALNRPITVRSFPLQRGSPPDHPPPFGLPRYDLEERRCGGRGGGGGGGGKVSGGGCFSVTEMKRRGRVASYKAYSVEGNIKGKIRRGWRWFRERCHLLVHGY